MDASLLRRLVAGLIMLLCATSLANSASSAEHDGGWAGTATCPEWSGAQVETAARLLAAHNEERARLGLPLLAWSCRLERDATQWAQALQQRGALEHAAASVRHGSGENLWMGSAGRFPVERMVGRFIEEKRHYRNGRFPDISSTGNWADAGHYSQVVWRDTSEVGCALAQGEASDVLVCRYRPSGNVRGRTAF